MNASSPSANRLKNFVKEEMRRSLLKCGREMVATLGPDYLTARKLAEKSGASVGTIYNLFATMDDFIQDVNMQTLDDIYARMSGILPGANPYININNYVDAFSSFIVNNPHLWMLLYQAHLCRKMVCFDFSYVRRIRRIEKLLDDQIAEMFGSLGYEERRLSAQVLEMSLFALSGFLAGQIWEKSRRVNKSNVCKLLLNTYLAGLNSLKRMK